MGEAGLVGGELVIFIKNIFFKNNLKFCYFFFGGGLVIFFQQKIKLMKKWKFSSIFFEGVGVGAVGGWIGNFLNFIYVFSDWGGGGW